MARTPPRTRPLGDLEDERPANRIEIQGTYLRWQVAQPPPPAHPPGKRGLVLHFSQASRLRMISLFNKLDPDCFGKVLFLTLTIPDTIDVSDQRRGKVWRSEFHRRVEHHLGHGVTGVWRQEWEKRKSGQLVGEYRPHYHVVILRERWIDKEFVRDAWQQTLRVEYARTEIKEGKNKKNTLAYVAKYAAKVGEIVPLSLLHTDEVCGSRQWGVFRKNLLPFAEAFTWEGEETEEIASLREYCLQGDSPLNKWGNKSFKKFGQIAQEAKVILFE